MAESREGPLPVPSVHKRHEQEATVTVYKAFGGHEEIPGEVCSLELPNGAVAQISRLPGRTDTPDGFLVRVWPTKGTAKHGGSNLTILSAIAYCPDEGMECRIDSVDARTPSPFYFADGRPG